MCCPGCRAVAQTIVDSGLTDFYRHRTTASPTAREVVPEFLRQVQVYDNPQVQKSFVRGVGENVREASLIIEGIVCAACVWLNERYIAALPGVIEVNINYATHRARVRWDDARIHLSDILAAVSRTGYLAHPYDPGRQQALLERERRTQLRRLLIAGVFGMQVMMIAVALYAGDWFGMEPQFRKFFYWISLGLCLPVILFSARPFFQSAWRDLRRRSMGMDVPVSLGISIAFAGSVWATLSGQGHVYYDSVVMFVFFLLTARYLELAARKRAAETSETLVHAAPAMATRMIAQGTAYAEEVVPVAELTAGDRVLIRPGETVPADGDVLEGRSSVNEALLTGESQPVTKQTGDSLVGGSINTESPLTMQVRQLGEDTILAAILRLLDRAQTEKPAIARLADRFASWFVAGVLVLAAAVALYWWSAEPARWLPITVAVLVVTCPCALSLATPAALTAATGSLTRRGLLVTRGHAVETLARATHLFLDKTGTLTEGRLQLVDTLALGDLAKDECLTLAASLEQQSEHPIATALRQAAEPRPLLPANSVINTPGAGIQGHIDGTEYFLGTRAFVADAGAVMPDDAVRMFDAEVNTVVYLGTQRAVCAAFVLDDRLRKGAETLVRNAKALGLQTRLISGDHAAAVQRVGHVLDLDDVAWGLRPQDKLDAIRAAQEQGAIAAMVGDGINDGPVLAQAQVSIAMGGGAHVAAASADMVLLSDRLPTITTGIATARKTLRIIRQNLSWAIAYNMIALPAAAMGYVAPWMAAIGMSASSLIVVGNALRLVERSNGADIGESD